jgi:hypothetical protein
MDGPAEAHDARAVCDDAILTPPQHRGLAARSRTCAPRPRDPASRARFERPAPQQTIFQRRNLNTGTAGRPDHARQCQLEVGRALWPARADDPKHQRTAIDPIPGSRGFRMTCKPVSSSRRGSSNWVVAASSRLRHAPESFLLLLDGVEAGPLLDLFCFSQLVARSGKQHLAIAFTFGLGG